MENKINKPFALSRDELVQNIVNSINSSGLPLFMVEYILKDILNEVNATIIKQTQSETQRYYEQLAELNDSKPTEEPELEPVEATEINK